MKQICTTKRPGMRLFASDTKGAAFLEATIVIPFLLIIGLGVFEFGNYMYLRHHIQSGVRDAARYLARLPWPVSTAHETNARVLAVTGTLDNAQPARVSGWATTDVSINYKPVANSFSIGSDPAFLYPGSVATSIQVVQVSTSITYQDLGFLGGYFNLGPMTINIAHEERHIGNT